MHSVVRQAVLVAFQLFCLQGQSDSCAADGTCAETLHRRSFDEPLQKPHREPKEVLRDTKRFGRSGRSILEQEVLELEALSELYQKQLALLEDLQRGLHAGLGRHLPKASVHALLEGVPPLSEQVIGGAPPGRLHAEEEDDAEFGETKSLGGATSTAAAPNDFVVSKAVVPQESAATLLGLLPLRNHRSTAPTPTSQIAMPTVLVVAVQEDRDICLFTVSGDLLYTFSSGHKQAVAQLAISPMQDEYIVATADLGGVMRVHRLNVRPRRNPQEQRWRVTNPEEEKVSNHLGSPANITAQFHLATRIPLAVDNISNSSPTLTAFVMTAVQGVKYFLTGDSVGWISVLTRNGTLHERFRVSSEPVKRINAHLGNVVYVSGNQWGLLDLEKGTARAFSCYKYQGPGLLDAVTDTASQSRVLAADVEGTIWVFSVREKRDCKVEHRFPVGTTRAPLSLSSIRGFLLAVEKSRHSRSEVTVLNMTHVGKGWDDPARDVSPISWKRSSSPLRDWAVQRRYQEGDLLVTLSEDGMEIEVFELMMQVYQPPPSDMLGNFKLPIFAAAMVMVMGYQFVKQKSPFETGEEPGGA